MHARSFTLALIAWLLTGCHLFGGVRVDAVATSVQRPANVAVYLSASNGDQSLTGLNAKNFKIFEDGKELSAEQTQQVLLPREVAAVHRAMLLVDMSGPITTGDTRSRLAQAAARFVTAARRNQPVTVYAFDGGARIRRIEEYQKGEEAVDEVSGLASYTSRDTSSNLHSAVVEALKELDTRLMATAKPIRIGTLAVFVQGPDLARRVEENAMLDAIDETSHHVLGIGVEGSEYDARRLGEDGHYTGSSISTLNGAFAQAGERAAQLVDQYYLLSYCSPARAGRRTLRVQAITTDSEGKEISGRLTTEFDATGFTAGCDPQALPRFVVPPRPKGDEKSSSADKPTPATPTGASPATDTTEDTIVPPPDTPDYAQ